MTAKLLAVLTTHPWLPCRFDLRKYPCNEADFVETLIESALLHKTHPLLLFLFGRHHHHHLPTFHFWKLFDYR